MFQIHISINEWIPIGFKLIEIGLIIWGIWLARKKLNAAYQGIQTAETSVVSQIQSSDSIAARNNSLKIIDQFNSDAKVSMGLRTISESIKCSNLKLREFAERKTEGLKDDEKVKFEEDLDNIIYTLNFFENIAIGIQHNVYDKEIIEKSLKGMIIRLFDEAKTFIDQIRIKHNNERIFREVEWLYNQLEIDE